MAQETITQALPSTEGHAIKSDQKFLHLPMELLSQVISQFCATP